MRHSLSILCYNRSGMTRTCLETVLKHTRTGPDLELLITDNGSTDDTLSILAEFVRADHRIRIIHHRTNLGVQEAKRIALKESRGEFFISLDNDCTVGPQWLELLSDPLADPSVGQVGRADTFCTLDHNGVGIRGPRLDYIDGSCFITRGGIAKAIGLCDPIYHFAYCEDSDYSLKLRKAGWRLAVARTKVVHSEHATAHAAGMDLKGIHRHNHQIFVNRWKGYLTTRRFGHPGEPDVSGHGPPRKEGTK